jgi:hypothetical protein
MAGHYPLTEEDAAALIAVANHAADTTDVHGTGTVVTTDNIATYAPSFAHLTENVADEQIVSDYAFYSTAPGSYWAAPPNPTDAAFEVFQAGDVNDRLYIDGNGAIHWGNGTVALDTNLYRSAANTLKTDDTFIVGGSLTVSGANALVTNLAINGGQIGWVGDAAANIYRVAAGKLGTDGGLRVGGAGFGLEVNGTNAITLGGDTILSRAGAGFAQVQAGGSNPTKLIVKGTASQSTTNLMEWRDSGDVALAEIQANGAFVSRSSTGFYARQTADSINRIAVLGSGTIEIGTGAANRDVVISRAAAGALQVQGANAATGTTLNVRRITGQTANLQEWQDEGGSPVALLTPGGTLRANNMQVGAPGMGGAARALGIENAATVPGSTPTTGGVLYAEAGALKWRGSSGPITPIAPA